MDESEMWVRVKLFNSKTVISPELPKVSRSSPIFFWVRNPCFSQPRCTPAQAIAFVIGWPFQGGSLTIP